MNTVMMMSAALASSTGRPQCTVAPSPEQCYIRVVQTDGENSDAQKCWTQFQESTFHDAQRYPGFLKSESMASPDNSSTKSYVVFQNQTDYTDWQSKYHPRGPHDDPYAGYHGVLLKTLQACMKNAEPGNIKNTVLDNTANSEHLWNGVWKNNSCIQCPSTTH
jgi:hypothetical protein